MTASTKQHWPNLQRLLRQRDQMRAIVRELDDELYETFLRWAGESGRPLEEGPGTKVIDGYPTTSSGQGVVRASNDMTSVERAALHDGPTFDPIDDSLRGFFARQSEALGVLRELDRARSHLRAHGAEIDIRRPSRQGAGNCEACGRIVSGAVGDKLLSGYCGRCRKRWERAAYPDRMAFKRTVEADTAAEKQRAKEGG